MDKIGVIQRRGSLTRVPRQITFVRVVRASGLSVLAAGHFAGAGEFIFLGLLLLLVSGAVWTIKR